MSAPNSSGSNDLQQENFIKAMSEGGGYLFQSNIVIHGPPGAGKTSLKRVILGQPPFSKEKQNSTNIIENAVRVVRTEQLKQFEVVDNEQMIVNLARTVQELATNKYPKVHPIHRSQTIPSDEEDANSPALFLYDDEDLPDIQISDNPSHPTALHSINNKLKDVTPSSEMFDSKWYHLIDSGGQPQFYDILPLVYRSPAINIVVIRLTEELDNRLKVTFHCQGRDDYKLPDKLLLTNRQFIVRMCQTAANCAKSGGSVSNVMVVGTHRDILDTEGEEASKSKIKKLNDELKRELKEFEELGILICKSDDEIIFDIDTMATGEKRQQYTKDLQQTISDVCEANSIRRPVPLKWFAFQLELAKGKGVVRMEKCYEVGQELEMNEVDVKNALVYFSRAALLMYFPGDIPDLVLTKVDPLIDRLSLLAKASFQTPKPTLRAQCIRLREKGLFDKKFLMEVLRTGKVSSDDLQNNEFLKLLESLKIAVHIEGEEYFLPSALSFEPPSENCELNQSSVSLAFCWDERYLLHRTDEWFLPHGFFFTVAIELLNRSDIAGDPIFILRDDQQGIVQRREEIQVSGKQGKVPGVVKLMDRKKWIQVSYFGIKCYCPVVYNAVDTAIHRAVDQFQHTGISPLSVKYFCPLLRDQGDHFCYLTPDQQYITCSLDNEKTGPVTDDMKCWIPKQTEPSTCMSEDQPATDEEQIHFPVDEKSIKQKKQSITDAINKKAKGILFFIGVSDREVGGTDKDGEQIPRVFREELGFVVYRQENTNCHELSCLVQAIARGEWYTRKCKYMVFYYAGHGGINKNGNSFIKLGEGEEGRFYIQRDILSHFKRHKVNNKKRCLFFFDCCLSEADGASRSHNYPEVPIHCLTAFATCSGERAEGFTATGGMWTQQLCEKLKLQLSISDILDHTHTAIVEKCGETQEPVYVSNAGAVFLKGTPKLCEEDSLQSDPVSVWKRHIPDLNELLDSSKDVLLSLTGALHAGSIISDETNDEVLKSNKGGTVITAALDKKISADPSVIHEVLGTMDVLDQLCGLVRRMKNELKDPDDESANQSNNVLERHHDKLVEVFETDYTSLRLLCGGLLPRGLIDQKTSSDVSKHCYTGGADKLFKTLEQRVCKHPNEMGTILDVLEKQKPLHDLVEEMKKEFNNEECMKLEAALTNKENELRMKSKDADLQRKLSRLKVSDIPALMVETATVQAQWKQLGEAFGIKSSILEEMSSDQSLTELRLLYELLRYWILEVGGSWGSLVGALKSSYVEQKKLAAKLEDKYLGENPEKNAIVAFQTIKGDEKPLEESSVAEVMKAVFISDRDGIVSVDWKVLGLMLGLPDNELENIQSSNSSVLDCQKAMLRLWVQLGQAYWSLLAKVLGGPVIDETKLSKDIIIKQNLGTVQKCKPDLEDVLNLLKRRSCKWYEIGVGLKVDNGFCQCQLKESIMTSDLEKLKAVLNKWIESECSEVSWNHLIQVLIDIELVDVAKKVRSYLQTDLSAIKKYRWVNNMHEGYTYTTKFVIISLFFAVVFIFIFW